MGKPDTHLSGAPKLTACDSAIGEHYGYGDPTGVTLPKDNFSVRWSLTNAATQAYEPLHAGLLATETRAYADTTAVRGATLFYLLEAVRADGGVVGTHVWGCVVQNRVSSGTDVARHVRPASAAALAGRTWRGVGRGTQPRPSHPAPGGPPCVRGVTGTGRSRRGSAG
ncbi:hypothetical protein [Streptomyces sp. LN704]|uniref:hypothetical protein n=1 Tax=unclassified Streptomyces TaxID=2593676 RepID=UPI003715C497